jgi:membrane protein YqaA with SNARE-associated domain
MNETIQFLTEYGPLVLFVVVFVEQIGLPLPALPVLVAAGVLAGTGHVNFWVALGVTVSRRGGLDLVRVEPGRVAGCSMYSAASPWSRTPV